MSRWGALCPVPWQSCIPNRQLLGHTIQTSIFDFMALCDPTESKLPPKLGLNYDELSQTGSASHAVISSPAVYPYGRVPGEQQKAQKERGSNSLSWDVLP